MISLRDLADMPEVIVRPVLHYEAEVVGIFFKKDDRLIRVVKKIPGVRFSQTLRGWYVPFADDVIDVIRATFADVAIIEASSFDEDGKTSGSLQRVCPAEYVDHLIRRRYSNATVLNYCTQFSLFLQFCGKDAEEIIESDVNAYMKHLVASKKVSTSTQNVAINAIKFYFEKVKQLPQKFYSLERPIREQKHPLVLSEEEVVSILKACDNLKHKTMLSLIYAAGLRRSELLNLTTDTIDKDRRQIIIRAGKGKKDRFTLLSERIIEILEKYYEAYKPKRWVFEGDGGEQYSATSLQKVFRKALRKSGISKPATLHTLRHSFATHLLENGTDIRYIQALLGHNSSRTTEIYAHVTRKGFEKIRSPLDNLSLD